MEMHSQPLPPQGPQVSQPVIHRYPQLIRNYEERIARHHQKVTTVLTLLRDEIWTSVPLLATLLEVSYSSAHRLAKGMAELGLVSQEMFTIRGQRGVREVALVGITNHGLAHAWQLDETVQPRAPWEPSKINPLYVTHTLMVQQARIAAQRLGWTEWVPGRLLANTGMAKVPDAVVLSPTGKRVALELERHIKSLKRYEVVLGAYVAEMKKGLKAIDHVDYLCPTADTAARLARTLGMVKHLRFEGNGKEPVRVASLAQEHLDRFRLFGAKDWPDGQYVLAKVAGNAKTLEGDVV